MKLIQRIIPALAIILSIQACSGSSSNQDNSTSENNTPEVSASAPTPAEETHVSPFASQKPAVTTAADTLPLVVDFSATWCGPCQRLKPVFEELAAEYDGKATFRTVDIDAEPEIADRYGIQAVPTIMIFENPYSTKLLTIIQGYNPEELKKALSQYCK